MSCGTEPAANVTAVSATADGWQLTISGELDIGNVHLLQDALAPLLAQRPDAVLELDVAAVDFMDSSTLAVLLRARAGGATIRLCRPSPVVVAAVRSSGLAETLLLVP